MKRFVTILLLSVVGIGAYAQNQSVLTGRVTGEYRRWQSNLSSTKAFLVLSQDKYIPGDTIFFSTFFLTEDGMYAAGPQIIRVALVDSRGVTVHRQLVSTFNGVGANQIILPASMPDGNYLVVAYNDYMNAFSRNFYFRKEIKVVSRNSIQHDVAAIDPIVAAEGGHFVQDVPNRLVMVAADSTTRAITISTGLGREVAAANIDRFGTGSVVFTPEKGVTYFVTANGKRTPLAIEDDGCSLQLTMLPGSNSIAASVALPAKSKWRNGEFVAALTVNGTLYYTAAFKMQQTENMTVKFPTKDLPGGLALLSVIAEDGSMLASRHFYMPSSPQLRCNLQVSNTTVASNEKVTSDITITDTEGKPLETIVTVTATSESLFERSRAVFPRDINIVSELGAFYSRVTSPGWQAAFDNYLATQPGSISWSTIMAAKEPELKNPPKFVAASGLAYFADTKLPIPDSSILTGYMMKNRFAFEVDSGMNGKLDLAFLILDGKDEMYYFLESEGKELERVKIRWTYDSLPFRASPWKSTDRSDKYASFMVNKTAIDRSFNFYTSTSAKTATENFDTSLEGDLRNTGTTINVTEYRVFPDMPELILEIIPRLYYRKNGKREFVRVVFSDAYLQPKSSPLYIIDGVLTRSSRVFLSLNPADIITMKIIHDPAELSRFYAVAKHGIVIVKTKKGNAARNAEKSSVAIDGINEVIPFRVPVERPAGTRRKPDFRSTMYWNPEVRTDKNGKATVSFFTTDDIGKVKILVRGLAGGQYFEVEKTIEVSALK